MARRRIRAVSALLLALGAALSGPGLERARAQEAHPVANAPAAPASAEALRPATPGPRPGSAHPLAWVLKFANEERAYLRQAVRNFVCRVTKRERIDGELQDYHYIDMRVREQLYADARVTQPLSVLLEFLAPSDVAGRRVLFVAGQNDDKLLVRKGGKRFGYVVVDVDPFGPIVRQDSLMPINEVGFSQLLDRMIRILQQDMVADPAGDNTIVEHIEGVAINECPCDMLRITHPSRGDGLQFFKASVYIDRALHVPVRFDVYDWPQAPGQQPPLTAEFTYTNVRLNVHLDDADFAPAILRAP